MKKCAICGKEINGGFLVEKECLADMKKDLKRQQKDNERLLAWNKNIFSTISELQAENAELKARLEKIQEGSSLIGQKACGVLGAEGNRWIADEVIKGFTVLADRIILFGGCWRIDASKNWFIGDDARAVAEAQLKVLEETKMKCKHCGYEEATTKTDEFYIEKGKRHHIKSKSETKRIPPDEPVSTAEKLLWLIKNHHICELQVSANGEWKGIACNNTKKSPPIWDEFENVIAWLYDWAKEQEK